MARGILYEISTNPENLHSMDANDMTQDYGEKEFEIPYYIFRRGKAAAGSYDSVQSSQIGNLIGMH